MSAADPVARTQAEEPAGDSIHIPAEDNSYRNRLEADMAVEGSIAGMQIAAGCIHRMPRVVAETDIVAVAAVSYLCCPL